MKIMKETTEFQVPSDLSGPGWQRLLSSRLVSDICRDARAALGGRHELVRPREAHRKQNVRRSPGVRVARASGGRYADPSRHISTESVGIGAQ